MFCLVTAHSPYTPGDTARVVDTNELVAGRRHVEVRLFLVHKECVRHPDVFYELGPDRERLHALPLAERQTGIRPELPEVEIQRKILVERYKNKIYDGKCFT